LRGGSATSPAEAHRADVGARASGKMSFLATHLPDFFGAGFDQLETKPPEWSSGLFACLDGDSKQIVDVGFIGLGSICPLLYALNRYTMLKTAPGERLYMCSAPPCECSHPIHAAAFGLWYIPCAPCMGAKTRTKIRESSGIPGAFSQDLFYHTLCPSCALAQEARHLRESLYKGEKEVDIPNWRKSIKLCFPLAYLDTKIFDAIKANDDKLVRTLILNKGANVNCMDKDRTSPLMLAAVLGYQKVCAVLLEAGADLHHVDRIEQSAVHRAAMKGHAKVVLDLWKAGGHCDKPDSFGRTPFDYSVGDTRKLMISVLGIEEQKVMTTADLMKASGVRTKK